MKNSGFTVKELKEFLAGMDESLPVNINIIEKSVDGVDEGFLLPLEAAGTDGETVQLACYNT